MRTALTIAGSDPGAGAGIQADLKTFAAHGVFGTTAITAITVQNTRGVRESVPLSPLLVTAETAGAVADRLALLGTTPIVLDTVILSSSGYALLEPAGVEVMQSRLLPL